jgi:hypothetical protein
MKALALFCAFVAFTSVAVAQKPSKAIQKQQEAARHDYAATLDRALIDAEYESNTWAMGKNNTSLVIGFPSVGRVFANKLEKAIDWKKLKELGFKKVYIFSGPAEFCDWDVMQHAN